MITTLAIVQPIALVANTALFTKLLKQPVLRHAIQINTKTPGTTVATVVIQPVLLATVQHHFHALPVLPHFIY